MKKALATILIAVLFISLLPTAQSRADHASYYSGAKVDSSLGELCEDGIYYFVSKKPKGGANGEVYAAGCRDSVKKVSIPALVKSNSQKYDVVGVNDYAYWGKSNITSVTVANGVSYIGEYAFSRCDSLKSVSLPSTVTTIKHYALSDNPSLTTLTLPKNLKSIPDALCSDDPALKSITIPSKVTEIGSYAFLGCSSLKSLTIPKSVTTIGDNAFSNCTGIKTIKFGSGLKVIGSNAFSSCSSLTEVTVPKKVTQIGEAAFQFCSSLKKVTLGVKVKEIGPSAFASCHALETVTAKGNNIKTVGNCAFYYDEALTVVDLGDSIETIGESAFDCCPIREFNFGKKLKSIGMYAFCDTDLVYVSIPGTCKTIGDSAFYNCDSLEEVYMAEGVESLGEFAFQSSDKLKYINFPSTIHDIGRCAVENTAWLYEAMGQKWITNGSGGGYYTWPFDAYKGGDYSDMPDYININDVNIWLNPMYTVETEFGTVKKYKTELVYPRGVKLIVMSIGCERDVTKVVVPEGVETIRGSLFAGTYGDPVDIDLPSSLINIEAKFSGERLESITIPVNVKNIAGIAFSDVKSLKKVIFKGKKLKYIGVRAFAGTSITSISLPDSVTEIDDMAFEDTGLTSFTIPKKLKRLGTYALAGTEVTVLNVPDTLCINEPPKRGGKLTFKVYKNTEAYKALKKMFETYAWEGSDYMEFKIKALQGTD